MALSFPLSADAFANTLKIASVEWVLEEYIETSGTGRGEILTSELAPPKWRGQVDLATMHRDEADRVQALIEAIGAHNRFFIHNPRRPYPISDPNGNVIRNWSMLMTIQDLKVDNKAMRLIGLPANYKLSVGDMIAFNVGNGRRAMHRVVEDALASGAGGLTTYFEVRPHFRSGTVIDTPVSLRKASAKVMMVPGSFQPGSTNSVVVSGMGFSAIEVY